MLTQTRVRAAKPRTKPYKLFDERGLYLLINPNDSRWWRLKYRLHDKEKLLSLGVYPDTSLKRAREKRNDARKFIADGIDPSDERKTERTALSDTFEGVAREPVQDFLDTWLQVILPPRQAAKSLCVA